MDLWHIEFTKLLNSAFNERKEKNPKYSMRSFAKKLGISIGTLSDILSSKREIGSKRAVEILHALSLPVEVKNQMLIKMREPVDIERSSLTEDHHFIIREWIATAVLVYFDLKDIVPTVAGVCAHLGLSQERADLIVKELVKKDLLKMVNGTISKNVNSIQTTVETPIEFIKLRHIKNLELAQKAVTTYPREKRDITNLCFAGNPEMIESVRQEIRQMHAKASALMKTGDCSELYFLTVALHPVDKELARE